MQYQPAGAALYRVINYSIARGYVASNCDRRSVERRGGADAHLDLAVKLYGPELRAVQLVWTDMSGRWPWDAAFEFDGLRQPVLGVRQRAA